LTSTQHARRRPDESLSGGNGFALLCASSLISHAIWPFKATCNATPGLALLQGGAGLDFVHKVPNRRPFTKPIIAAETAPLERSEMLALDECDGNELSDATRAKCPAGIWKPWGLLAWWCICTNFVAGAWRAREGQKTARGDRAVGKAPDRRSPIAGPWPFFLLPPCFPKTRRPAPSRGKKTYYPCPRKDPHS